jgi:hypothetical protein
MIVDHFNLGGLSLIPSKANSILVVDADAELTAAVTAESLQPVTRDGAHVFQ